MHPTLLHLLPPNLFSAWKDGLDWAPPSLAKDGFIHLCTPDQAPGVRARFYAQGDVFVAVLETSALGRVVFEDTMGHGLFPHLYGPIPWAAVRARVRWPQGVALEMLLDGETAR